MEIGKPQRIYTVEPIADPVPREVPIAPPPEPPTREPSEPEKTSAP
jgi:hypothetical protein